MKDSGKYKSEKARRRAENRSRLRTAAPFFVVRYAPSARAAKISLEYQARRDRVHRAPVLLFLFSACVKDRMRLDA